MPGSYREGKAEAALYLRTTCPPTSRVLDIGPGMGVYSMMLRSQFATMDACEAHAPYVERFNLRARYDTVHVLSCMDFKGFDAYDLAILGDVLEHLSVDDAQQLLHRLRNVREVLVSVPYLYPQGAVDGVEWERHLQPDLTHEVFMARYPGFRLLYTVQGDQGAALGGYYVRARPQEVDDGQ